MESPLKILLLEDNSDDAEIIRRLLEKKIARIEFELAMNKKSFLEILDIFLPDIILSDYCLPDFDAAEALKIARQKFPDIPFIMVTGMVSEEFAASVVRSGADDYIIKDRMVRLPEAIQAVCIKKQAERERKDVVDRLISSEERYRTVIERISDGFIALDREWNITYINAIAEDMFRLGPEPLLGKNLWLEFPEAVNKAFYNAFHEAMKTLKHIRLEDYSASLNRWLETDIYPSQSGVTIYFRDISEQRLAEVESKKKEENYRVLIERITDAFIALDPNFCFIYVNAQAGELLRRDPASLIGRNVWEEFPIAKDSATYNALNLSMKEQRYVSNTDYYAPLDLWQENHIYPSRDGLSIFVKDISERMKKEEEIQRSNERFELVAQATNNLIWDWNLRTNKIWWNSNYYSHFEFEEVGVTPDISSWTDRIHFDDRQRVISGIDECIAKRNHSWSDEYRLIKADGTIAFIFDRAFILYDEKDVPYRLVGAKQDITIRMVALEQLRNSLNEKQALVERMSAILNTLPANIALLDNKGLIVEVNECWKSFAERNEFAGNAYGVGSDYMKISTEIFRYGKKDEELVAAGVKNVLERKVTGFEYEYSCQSPTKTRRFRMVVTPLKQEYSGAVAMHIDISEIRRLENEKIQSKITEQIRLAEAILSAQEKERNFIAQELHDNVNQILVGTKLILSSSKNRPNDIQTVFQSSIENIQLAIDENRKIAHELVSPDFETKVLSEQISTLAENMLGASGIRVEIDTSNFQESMIDNVHRLAIYRITQEHCTNIVKYAKATQVNIILKTTSEVFNMVIADNGVGMEAGKGATGIGLKNIKGRLSVLHGVATIETKTGKGFRLGVEIPLRVEVESV